MNPRHQGRGARPGRGGGHVGMFTGPVGTFCQRTELSQPQKTLFAKLKVAEPPRILDATPATA